MPACFYFSVGIILFFAIGTNVVLHRARQLSLCSAVFRSPRLARVAGQKVLNFTRSLLEIESKSTELDLDALVEAACGTTRKVVGDGPMGDLAARTAEILKSE